MKLTQSRRRFLAALSSAGAACLVAGPNSFAAEPPPETTTVRFPKFSNTIYGAASLERAQARAEGLACRWVFGS
jgi:NitT/TauT family transport system substrate-binding protein